MISRNDIKQLAQQAINALDTDREMESARAFWVAISGVMDEDRMGIEEQCCCQYFSECACTRQDRIIANAEAARALLQLRNAR